VTRPIGGGGGRLGRVSSGGVRSKVVSGDGRCRSDGTTRSRGRRWSHENIDPITGGGEEGERRGREYRSRVALVGVGGDIVEVETGGRVRGRGQGGARQ